ncbi:MAG: hypothetical protein JEZ03_18610, partial [Bacteroidales bacterium]|nr:hypothetical protein [Bacteroidales bacterium]
MNKSKFVFSVLVMLLILLTTKLQAQIDPTVEFSAGIGTYNMKNLKEFQDFFQKRFDFETDIKGNFQASPNYKLMLTKFNRLFDFGLGANYSATHSQLFYPGSDAVYALDFDVSTVGFVVNIWREVLKREKWNVKIYGDAGFNHTWFNLKEKFVFETTNKDQEYFFTSMGVILEPGISLNYNFYNDLSIGVYGGY